jgi:tetratricopeptide (TPR) repeat protein
VFARQIAQRGMDAVDTGNWQSAEEFFAKAVDICPVDEQVRSRYAEALWHRGSRREALEHMNEAVRLSGGDPNLVVQLGEMYLQTGDLGQAGQLANRALGSGRQLPNAFRLRGEVLRREGKWRDALADFHRALSLQPQYPEVQLAIAEVYYREGRPQRALSTLQALAGSYPSGEEPPEVLYWQGLACAALGRHEQAVTHLAAAETRGLQSADLLCHLARARYDMGDPSAAQITLERLLELDPQHAEGLRLAESIRNSREIASLPK